MGPDAAPVAAAARVDESVEAGRVLEGDVWRAETVITLGLAARVAAAGATLREAQASPERTELVLEAPTEFDPQPSPPD